MLGLASLDGVFYNCIFYSRTPLMVKQVSSSVWRIPFFKEVMQSSQHVDYILSHDVNYHKDSQGSPYNCFS